MTNNASEDGVKKIEPITLRAKTTGTFLHITEDNEKAGKGWNMDISQSMSLIQNMNDGSSCFNMVVHSHNETLPHEVLRIVFREKDFKLVSFNPNLILDDNQVVEDFVEFNSTHRITVNKCASTSCSNEDKSHSFTISCNVDELNWSITDRDMFKELLLAFGYQHYQQVQLPDKLAQKSHSSMKNFGLAFMLRLHQTLEGDRTAATEFEYLDKVLAGKAEDKKVIETIFENYPVMKEWSKMAKDAASWTRRLQMLHFFHVMMQGAGDPEQVLNIIPPDYRAKLKGCSWWTPADDVSMLLGIYKHGYSCHEKVLADPDLSFSCDSFLFKANEDLEVRRKAHFPEFLDLTNRSRRMIEGAKMAYDVRVAAKIDAKTMGEKRAAKAEQKAKDKVSFEDIAMLNKNRTQMVWRPESFRKFIVLLKRWGVRLRADDMGLNWTQLRENDPYFSDVRWEPIMSHCYEHMMSDVQEMIQFAGNFLKKDIMTSNYPFPMRSTDTWNKETSGFDEKFYLDRISSLLSFEEGLILRRHINLNYDITYNILPSLNFMRTVRANAPPLNTKSEVSQLPLWWARGHHDSSLLRGVARFGISFEHWDEMFADSTLNWEIVNLKYYTKTTTGVQFLSEMGIEANGKKESKTGKKKAPSVLTLPTGWANNIDFKSIFNRLVELVDSFKENYKPKGKSKYAKRKLIADKNSTFRAILQFTKKKARMSGHEHDMDVSGDVVMTPAVREAELLKCSDLDSSNLSASKNDNGILYYLRQHEDPFHEGHVSSKRMVGVVNRICRKSDESIIYPISIHGGLTLMCIGKMTPIITNKNTTIEGAWLPIGYVAVRQHQSYKNVEKICSYECRILQQQDSNIIFQVTASDDIENVFTNDNPTIIWRDIEEKIKSAANHDSTEPTCIDGWERFGILESTVTAVIQESEPLCRFHEAWCIEHKVPLARHDVGHVMNYIVSE